MILCSVDAPRILYSFVHWDGIWSVRSCVGCWSWNNKPSTQKIQFCDALSNRAVVVSCPCCSLFRSQRPTCTGPILIPDLSGLVRSPRARFPGTASVLLPCAELPVLFTACVPGCRKPPDPRARPVARIEGCAVFAFPADGTDGTDFG